MPSTSSSRSGSPDEASGSQKSPESSSSSSSSSSGSSSSSRESSAEPRGENIRLPENAANNSEEPTVRWDPPEGSVPLEHGQCDTGEFEWDAIQEDDDLELVLIRVPPSIKAKHLDGLKLKLSKDTHSRGKLGTFERKRKTYDIWSQNALPPTSLVSAEEMKSFRIMLPRRTKGNQLYLSSKAISDHYIFTQAESEVETAEQPQIPQAARFQYPEELLTHSFVPYGADSSDLPPPPPASNQMEVEEHPEEKVQKKRKSDNPSKSDEKTAKKRKKELKQQEQEVPSKKSKKAKHVAS